jgi:hypothetical protein
MPGDLHAAVIDHQFRGAKQHPHLPADQPHQHRIAIHPHRDLRVAVHPRAEQPAGRERLSRQRPQQRLLDRKRLADGVGARPDPPGIVVGVPPVDHRVELGQRGDLWDRDEMVAAKPADLALHPAFLVGALLARLAVERLQTVFSELAPEW